MNPNKTTAKNAQPESTAQLLVQLSATRASIEAGVARYAREVARGDVDKAEATSRRISALKARFAAIKGELPEVKLDSETGEYLLAKNDTGRAIFRVRVKRIGLVDVYDVPASSETEAVAKAVKLQDVTPVRWNIEPALGEVISADEE